MSADKKAATAPVAQPAGEPVAWMYTLEYGQTVADRKVSQHQLNYPFGVCGADYLQRNADGVSYVRQTPLYTTPPAAAATAWDEGYRAGIADECASEDNIGIAGFSAKVQPNRANPYRASTPGLTATPAAARVPLQRLVNARNLVDRGDWVAGVRIIDQLIAAAGQEGGAA